MCTVTPHTLGVTPAVITWSVPENAYPTSLAEVLRLYICAARSIERYIELSAYNCAIVSFHTAQSVFDSCMLQLCY